MLILSYRPLAMHAKIPTPMIYSTYIFQFFYSSTLLTMDIIAV